MRHPERTYAAVLGDLDRYELTWPIEVASIGRREHALRVAVGAGTVRTHCGKEHPHLGTMTLKVQDVSCMACLMNMRRVGVLVDRVLIG